MQVKLVYTNCPRCNAASSRMLYKGKDYLYGVPGEFYAARCENCGLLFQNPAAAPSDVHLLYPREYHPHVNLYYETESLLSRYYVDFLKEHKKYTALKEANTGPRWNSIFTIFPSYNRWRSSVDLVPAFAQNGALLEIGSASGNKLLSLKKLGWKDLHGIEMSEHACEESRKQGLDIKCGLVEDVLATYPDNSFDVILMSMVIEHLLNPFKTLAVIASKVKPGGQFVFSTVTVDCVEYKMYREFWSCFDFPRHMVYFSKKDIIDMLSPSFDDITVVHQSAPVDFMRGSRWRSENGKKTIFDSIVLLFEGTKAAELAGLILAWLGMTGRISVSCTKKI